MTVSYSPTAASGQTLQTAALNLGMGNVSSDTPQTVVLIGTSAALSAGSVTATNNPQVALYSMTLPYPGSMTVSFGLDTTYGRKTWSQTTTVAGGQINMLVAGMLANTKYHMQANVQFDNGLAVTDADHTFATGSVPPGLLPSFSVTPTTGLTPQPGVELVDLLAEPAVPLATDLNGNVIWTYLFPERGSSNSIIYPIKLLPNGHFLCFIAPNATGALTAMREIDLAGNTIRQLTMADLNTSMTAAGYNMTLLTFTHDFAFLPNGHILAMTNMSKPYTNLIGYPGTTNVLGDVVVDLDQNFKPVWVWSEFDHLDVNRHPMNFPDWTHSNAIVYSPDDGNFLISIRHQNWIVKVDYNNGAGSGGILWKLGYEGDFTLRNGVDPTDWFYAQHDVNFVSSNTTGNFKIAIMDNGDDRVFPTGVTCDSPGAPACHYSTAQIMQLDENAKTASFLFHQILPVNLYSSFAGDTRVLENGNVEYNLAGVSDANAFDAYVFEVTPTDNPQTVWQMHIPNYASYRAFRIPSLYPGVQW